jgi:hypothetical protein
MAPRQQIERGKKQNDIEIVTRNIEGLKTNFLFLQSLNPGNSIICLQEHFIWELKKKIKFLLPSMGNFTRCSDTNDTLDGFKLPKGKGGVSSGQQHGQTISKC